MDTALYTSIAQAALLGDGFWQVNATDAGAFGATAMSTNQSQSQDQDQHEGHYGNPNPNQYPYQSPSQYQNPHHDQSHSQYQNPSHLPNQSSAAGTTAVMVPPTRASSAANVQSEQDCFELLALEFSSLPDREMPPEASDPAAGQQQLSKPGSSAMPDHRITPNTPTNNFVAKTIRAAMADVKPSSSS